MSEPTAPSPDPSLPSFEEEAPRQLSPLRILIALLLVAGVAFGSYAGVSSRLDRPAAAATVTWFAPYVDVTLTPTYSFQTPSADPAAQSVLGFVVADPASSCSPSWGGAYTLQQADQTLAVGARIAELSEQGARVVVSFGGRDHTDLATGCQNVQALTSAYAQVVDRYHLHTIDLDVEGTSLDDQAATDRRAQAIRALQVEQARKGSPLGVWLTLPVEPSGLQDNAISVLDAMLAARVDLSGVNILAMDFSHPTTDMLDDVEKAATAAEAQVSAEFRRYGVVESDAQMWSHVGVTVMIGQNDVAGQQFTVADAQGLVSFAQQVRLGRVSMWSINRDVQCGTTFAQVGLNSNTCSGTSQSRLQFAKVLGQLGGTIPAPGTATALPPQPDTNAADAPYPLWSPNASYQSDYKVVRDGYIYQAKWYNAGQDPAQQVQYSWQSPWELLGPVLAGDKAPTITTLPAGTYPTWSSSEEYSAGQKVMFDGLGYQAKWSNQGATPADAVNDPAGSPWQPLYSIPGEPAVSQN